MGSLGDGNGEIKPSGMKEDIDFSQPETQPFDFDAQFSLPSFSGDKADEEDGDELSYLQNTVPFDDNNAHFEDAFETQVVNLLGETQVLDFGGETQILDDLDCFQNAATQLLDEFDQEVALSSDGEGTEATEVLDDGDEISNDEVVRGDCGQSLGQEEKKEPLKQCNDASADEQRSWGIHVSTATLDVKAEPESKFGSVRRFTSVRAASLRASGLTARKAALQGINSESCSIRTDSHFSDPCTVDSNGSNPKVMEKINQTHDQGKYDKNSIGLRNGINFRAGCSTARKLFDEDCFAENQRLSCSSENADAREDLPQSPDCDGPIAGLSYIDSQEPGELSQANALNFVERFVNDNLMELDDEVDLGKSTAEKSELTLCAKGPQSLAKKTIGRSTAGKTGIFYWNDLLEDEGGGDIYCRRKEEFYGNGSHARKARTHPQKPKGRRLEESCNEDQPIAHVKMPVNSDSKLLLCKSKDNDKTTQEGQMDFRKNLFNEFDERFNSDSSREQLEAIAAKTGAPEVPDVGFDTQMAAEAMEELFYGERATDQNANQGVQSISTGFSKGSFRRKSWMGVSSGESTLGKGICCSDAAPVTRQSKSTKSSKIASVLHEKHSKNVRKECHTELLLPKTKKAKYNADENEKHIAGGIDMYKTPSKTIKQRKVGAVLQRSELLGAGKSTRGSSIKKQHPEEVHSFTPVACRTRQSLVMNMLTAEAAASNCRKGRKGRKEVGLLQENRTGSTANLSEVSNAKEQISNLDCNPSGEYVNVKPSNTEQLHLEVIARTNGNHVLSCPKRRRSCWKMSVDVIESDNLETRSKMFVQPEDNGQSITVFKGSKRNTRNTCIHSTTRRITRSSVNTCPGQNSEGKSSHQSSDKQGSGDGALNCNPTEMDERTVATKTIGPEKAKAAKHSDGNHDAISSPMDESLGVNVASDRSPKELKSPGPVCTTPVTCPTPVNAVSPVCMGEEYFKQSCKKNLSKSSLIKELRSLSPSEPEPISPLNHLRKRRDLASVKVLFSNHLDEDIVKQQKKILARLCISEASSILDATHFVTDKFVRTRNMLEAIASGKPVVTHLWLESIGQVNIHIDEEAYILRDIKKEKELGFCMPVSLAHARKRPLLQGRRVLITPNTKPGKETISHLVAAVHGKAVERIGRSVMKDDKVPDALLVLSCEEDYSICVPFLEKGAAVYSSELLLNGIVTQKLDYERHRLFADHVRRTRSTIWLRKDNKFHPVTKHK